MSRTLSWWSRLAMTNVESNDSKCHFWLAVPFLFLDHKTTSASSVWLEPLMSKVRNIWFLSPLVPSKRENLVLLSVYIFEGSVLIFLFLNEKIYKYVFIDIIFLLSLHIFWGKCVYFWIFEWKKLQLIMFFWHNCEFYHSKIDK